MAEGALSGWGGILASGLTAAAGVAMDNPYLVAAGGAAGKSYQQSYSNFNKSLIEEQRQTRLADAAFERQKNLKQFEYDMGAEDRALARQDALDRQAEETRRWEAGHKLATDQEKRLAEESKGRLALQGVQAQVAQGELDTQAHERKLREDPEYAKAHALKAAETQAEVSQVLADAQMAQDEKAKAARIQAIQDSDLSPTYKKLFATQISTGVDLSALIKQGKTQEVTSAMIEMRNEEYTNLLDHPDAKKVLNSGDKESIEKLKANARTIANTRTREAVQMIGGGGGGANVSTIFQNIEDDQPEEIMTEGRREQDTALRGGAGELQQARAEQQEQRVVAGPETAQYGPAVDDLANKMVSVPEKDWDKMIADLTNKAKKKGPQALANLEAAKQQAQSIRAQKKAEQGRHFDEMTDRMGVGFGLGL